MYIEEAVSKLEWHVRLVNQRFKVGTYFLYKPSIKNITPGYTMEVKAELGEASTFCEYDSYLNTF